MKTRLLSKRSKNDQVLGKQLNTFKQQNTIVTMNLVFFNSKSKIKTKPSHIQTMPVVIRYLYLQSVFKLIIGEGNDLVNNY